MSQALTNQSLPCTLPLQYTTLQFTIYPHPPAVDRHGKTEQLQKPVKCVCRKVAVQRYPYNVEVQIC